MKTANWTEPRVYKSANGETYRVSVYGYDETTDANSLVEVCSVNVRRPDWGQLISAAPELLAALEQLLSINPMSNFNETRDAKAVAREAIAKARGEGVSS